MTRVLIIGATGYVGQRLADFLVRRGQHTVYGIARSEGKAKSLALAEVTPIVCADPANNPTYLQAVRDLRIDIVVDVAGADHDSAKFLNDIKKLGEERRSSYAAAGIHSASKLGFVYTSGTWVHGSSADLVTDLDIVGDGAPTAPTPLVSWRTAMEKSVLASSDVLDVAVIRPALIYGRDSTIWTPFFLPLLQASRRAASEHVDVPLENNSRPGLIHVDDVASGLGMAVEKLPLINSPSIHPVFDLVTSQESMSEIFMALASAWKLQGSCALVGAGDDAFAEAMSTTFRGSSDRARQILGWEPTRLRGFVNDMDVYAAAFASQH